MSENEREIEEITKKEKSRMMRILGISLVLAVLVVSGVTYVVKNSETVFKPKLDIESGEKNVIKDTNDPQCRGIIASTKQIGIEFSALEESITKTLISGNEEEVRPLLSKILALKLRLKEIEKTISKSTFRNFETKSAKGIEEELEKWFTHVDHHFFFLERLATEHLEEIELKKNIEGTVVSKKKKYKKTPKQRLDGALLATDEAFQSFRVWHTGSLHPCGAATSDETPWTPSTNLEKTKVSNK